MIDYQLRCDYTVEMACARLRGYPADKLEHAARCFAAGAVNELRMMISDAEEWNRTHDYIDGPPNLDAIPQEAPRAPLGAGSWGGAEDYFRG